MSLDPAVLMAHFAERKRRYLWTDAFAVCNYLELWRSTGEERWRARALELMDDVHHVLGRFRPDDRRRGWLSGLSDAEAERHPTEGGLRIGKPLPERLVTEPYDPDLEWDRDGQYFHYLTKWMHALDQLARATGNPMLHGWARELALTSWGAFTDGPPWNRRMFWKLSVDRSRPLVRSMGQHDPLDGLVTCIALDATAKALDVKPEPSLAAAVGDFTSMVERSELASTDPLGIGGLFFDAMRLVQCGGHEPLVTALLEAGLLGLRHFVDAPDLRAPAHRRLAFRELGLAIGLEGLARVGGPSLPPELLDYLPLGEEIITFWSEDAHRLAPTWREHLDINEVMLATSYLPEGFVRMREPLP